MNWSGRGGRLLLAAGVATMALAAGRATHARAVVGPEGLRLVLVETTTDRAVVDVDGSGGSSAGDEFIFHAVLTRLGGKTVGGVDGHCTTLLESRVLCHAVYRLRGGTLSTTFAAQAGDATLHISIDGGTGPFDEARGQIVATRASQTAFREVVDID